MPSTLNTTTPIKTPTGPTPKRPKTHHSSSSSSDSIKSRFDAYNRLQSVAVAFGEKLPIPEIVAVGGQSDGKSSLLEALLGFRFNVREVEMGTRRPLIIQMIHDAAAIQPKCWFQEEDSEEYGSPLVLASAIADVIKSRTEAHLKKVQGAVSAKPIVMRAEYSHCPNLTIIDTPGFILKAKKGEPEGTPDEILSMVKSLAAPPHRLLLFLQQSSVEWCSSLWLDAIREIDPKFKRTIVVISKFDNRLKEFTEKSEVDTYLSASGYLGDNTHSYFVALPKDRGSMSNEEFRKQISQVDTDVLHHLRENVKGGFDEEKFASFIGFNSLRKYLEKELQKRYKEAAPMTLALIEQRCAEVSTELARTESKLQATSDVSHLRRFAILHTASLCSHVEALIVGAADPAPEQWGRTTEEEQIESCIRSWPGVNVAVRPPNNTLKLYGGAAFERAMHEFRGAAYSIDCPQVSREKVANILLAHSGKGGGGGVAEAAAEIARTAARSWLAPLLDTAIERLAFVLKSLFDLAIERNRSHDPEYRQKNGDMDGYIGFHAAIRRSYNNFIHNLAKQCKQLMCHHLDSVTSPYSLVCYENDVLGCGSIGTNSLYINQLPPARIFLDLSDGEIYQDKSLDQVKIHPKDKKHATHDQKNDSKDPLRERKMTVPETPSPDQPSDVSFGVKMKENGAEIGASKRHPRIVTNGRNMDTMKNQNGGLLFCTGDLGSKSVSSYSDICSISAQHFSKIREVLIDRIAPSALNSGFLTPCREKMVVSLALDLFADNDEKFMDMFVAPGTTAVLQSERQSLHKRQKLLHSCLNEFKNIAQAL